MASNNIPLEIQVEIMKRVCDVKSLIQFRSVSKGWKGVIDSPKFMSDHSRLNQTRPPRLLVMHNEGTHEFSFVSIVDDDSFPHHKFWPVVTPCVRPLWIPTLAGCSHGLVCFLNYCHRLIVVWNPSIAKSAAISLPSQPQLHALGFGVCPKTFLPKLVKISSAREAAVLTLTPTPPPPAQWRWRSVSINPSLRSMFFSLNAVDLDGLLHWVVYDPLTKRSLVISFDLTTEEFGQLVVHLPHTLAGLRCLEIFKLNDSLAVVDYHAGACDIWMMLKNSSFTKLFTLNPAKHYCIVGFRKNGQLMHHVDQGELQLYEPRLERMNGLGIRSFTIIMASYTESLLLLNHSD